MAKWSLKINAALVVYARFQQIEQLHQPTKKRAKMMREIRYTTITKALCQPVAELLALSFPTLTYKKEDQFSFLVQMSQVFPAGTIVALKADKVVGVGVGIFVELDLNHLPRTEDDLLLPVEQPDYIPNGSYYYGTDMAVHPDYRRRGIGRAIYDRRKALIKRHNKKGFVAAAVLPGFANYKDQLKIDDYVSKVIAGELFDPTLSVQLRHDFKVIRLLHKFFISPRSDNWSALICWENPDYLGIHT